MVFGEPEDLFKKNTQSAVLRYSTKCDQSLLMNGGSETYDKYVCTARRRMPVNDV